MMIVQNFSLTASDVEYLIAASKEHGISRAELVRKGLDLLRNVYPVGKKSKPSEGDGIGERKKKVKVVVGKKVK